MPQNSFEQLKMSKKLGGLTAPPKQVLMGLVGPTDSVVTRLTLRASVGDP